MESTYVVAKSCINNAGQSGTAAVRHWSRVCGLHLSVQLDNLLRRGIGNPELCMIKQQRVCTETSSCILHALGAKMEQHRHAGFCLLENFIIVLHLHRRMSCTVFAFLCC